MSSSRTSLLCTVTDLWAGCSVWVSCEYYSCHGRLCREMYNRIWNCPWLYNQLAMSSMSPCRLNSHGSFADMRSRSQTTWTWHPQPHFCALASPHTLHWRSLDWTRRAARSELSVWEALVSHMYLLEQHHCFCRHFPWQGLQRIHYKYITICWHEFC